MRRWWISSRTRACAAEAGQGFLQVRGPSCLTIPGPDLSLCVNADESEPATFNNRLSATEEDPHQVLEGILLACYATRATTAYLYIRYEYGKAYRVLQRPLTNSYSNT